MLNPLCMCRLGEAATFCWRLERVGSVGVPSEVTSLVAYEAAADGDAWAPAAPRVSCVTLPSQVRVLPQICEYCLRCLGAKLSE